MDYHSLYFSSQRGERDIWSYYGNGIKHPSKNYIKQNFSRFLFGYNPKVSFTLVRKDISNKWQYRHHPKYLDFDTEIGIHKTDTLIQGFLSFADTDYESFHYDYFENRIKKTNNLINTSKARIFFPETLLLIQIKPINSHVGYRESLYSSNYYFTLIVHCIHRKKIIKGYRFSFSHIPYTTRCFLYLLGSMG